MREIKFRCWDEKYKSYVSWTEIKETRLLSVYVNRHNKSSDPVNLEQYTGLKDKNGVEIYEGDIVKYSGHYSGDSYEKESIGVIEWDMEESSYPWKLTDIGFANAPEWCEVIGNIHEHQELLTGRKGAA